MNRKNICRLLLLLVLMATAFESCQKDDQSDPTNPGTTLDRDKYLGTWITQSTGPVAGTLNFTMSISAGNSSTSQIKISNFDAEGNNTTVFANVSGNTVALTQTTIGMDVISGGGTYNSNGTITFTYTVSDGQTTDNRTATAHK